MDEIAVVTMTYAEAVDWKQNVGKSANSLRFLLYEGYQKEAWKALGYANWTSCIRGLAEEFGFTENYLWKLSAANRVELLLDRGPVGMIPEKQLRPIVTLPPDEQREAWRRAVDTAPNGKVTAAHVQAVVDEMRGNGQPEESNVYQPVAATVFSFRSEEYDTPWHILAVARSVLGSFDLDPASNAEAQQNVQAGVYYTKEQDGLAQSWYGRVWLNPPYGKIAGKSNQEIWSQRLIDEYQTGNVTEAILLVKAALGYRWFEELFRNWPVCFLRDRLSFILDSGEDEGQSKQGTAIFYLGPDLLKFAEAFCALGRIIPPEAEVNAALFGQ